MLCTAILLSTVQAQSPIIPKPLQALEGEGSFLLNQYTTVITPSEELVDVASYFRTKLLRHTLIALPFAPAKQVQNKTIFLELVKTGATVEGEYELEVSSKSIHIKAASVSGVLYGTMSLLQLIQNQVPKKGTIKIAACHIEDAPYYKWRGLMLDVSRYFIPKEKILSILDWMAFYKLNVLHWHLTDSPGWRVEILKYPKLASIGGIGDQFNENKPAQFYSQSDIAEVVAYASKLEITVVPEIDMPGHATAANKAYPEFDGGGSEKYPYFTFNPGKEDTYEYLTNILREVAVLFPSQMVHLGGDEVSFGNQQWASDNAVVELMKKHDLEDLKAVEYHFMKRMADSLSKLNTRVLVWDELAESNLPKDKTTIFWWRHDKPQQLTKALKSGFSVVLCPRIPYYFDFVQDENHTEGRKWAGAFSSLEAVYSFDVSSLVDEAKYKNQVLGVQANLWTETINSNSRIDYMLFPRIAALAESAWSVDRRNYTAFKARLKLHLNYYKKAHLYHYNPFAPNEVPEPINIEKF